MKKHWAIFIDNHSNTTSFIKSFLKRNGSDTFKFLHKKQGALFSKLTLEKLMDEEDRHEHKIIQGTQQSLRSMSSGERKKVLLKHIFSSGPDYIILDNPFDNLDTDSQSALKKLLKAESKNITYIQIVSRKTDALPFISNYGQLINDTFIVLENNKETGLGKSKIHFSGSIPAPLEKVRYKNKTLVHFKNVSISYGAKPILQHIDWTINTGEFWQLIGKNGSGKTTILAMITGDNPKAFGQEIYLFGQKKGSGESVWDIKEKIGYYSPAMTDTFTGRHTVENMLISGLTDSIGLYTRPTEAQQRIVQKWLALLGFSEQKNTLFVDLTTGQQRLVMTARAMVKHPPLLILDEPTAGMDDASAQLLVTLVNKISTETQTAIIFVSHRSEPGLHPKKVFQLNMSPNGSTGCAKGA
ncbi:ATP-binding cassette domain-containing protein [Maribacter sp. 2304DJ31-5]|uniref:ATP-binding cassette domain-containing protein n=1 Tax=Maribacter sp. 2304DJ31-5 TaxID=3386273 RepID=UPI0039BC7191